MAETKIRLIYNLETGKKDLFIDLVSEADALPIEHEKMHRELVAQLLGQGILQADELGDITVERVRPGLAEPSQQATPELPPQQSEPS